MFKKAKARYAMEYHYRMSLFYKKISDLKIFKFNSKMDKLIFKKCTYHVCMIAKKAEEYILASI